MNFVSKLAATQARNQSWLCVGLDIVVNKMPGPLARHDDPLLPFAEAIIDATADLVCAYKPNLGFYLADGAAGMVALERIARYIPANIPIILDGKFGDIGPTAEMYARGAFEGFRADAVTLSPYVGYDTIGPFLKYANHGVFVLARTSNPGAMEFQNLEVAGRPLFEHVVGAANRWHTDGPGACGLVVGATYPAELARIRELAPSVPFLIPGVGAQGGDLKAAVQYGPTRDGLGPVINASRSVLYASGGDDFAKAARRAAQELREQINRIREESGQ